jgi:hypothetical protein
MQTETGMEVLKRMKVRLHWEFRSSPDVATDQ